MHRALVGCIAWMIVILPCCVGGTSLDATLPQAFYVAQNGNDNWSGKLPSPNMQLDDGPFLTLPQAQKSMQNSHDYKTTYIRNGTYYLNQPLALTGNDNNTTWQAYPRENPIISGGELLTNWLAESSDIYSTATRKTGLNAALDNTRLRVAQTPTWDPNYPNTSGWHSMVNGDTNNFNAFYFNPNDLSPADITPSVKIQAMFSLRWFDVVAGIANIDFNSQKIFLTLNYPMPYDPNGSWRLLNNGAYMTMPGTFGWRAGDNRFVIRLPEPGTINNHTVVVARLANLITLTNTYNVQINGLILSDTDYDGNHLPQQGAAILIKQSANNHIGNNTFRNIGIAIADQNSKNDVLANNTIIDSAADGIYTFKSDNIYISNNTITSYGRIQKASFGNGIEINTSTSHTIDKNTISTGPRMGIIVELGAQNQVSHVISNNQISNTNQETPDAGAIYLVSTHRAYGNQIDINSNYIVNSGTDYCTNCKGIYLDNQTSGVTIKNNFIEQSTAASIYVNGGNDVNINNNIGIIGKAGNIIYVDSGTLDGQDLEASTNGQINAGQSLVFVVPARVFKSSNTNIVINAQANNGNQTFDVYLDQNTHIGNFFATKNAQDYSITNNDIDQDFIHEIAITAYSSITINSLTVNNYAMGGNNGTFPENFIELNTFNTTPDHITSNKNIIYSYLPINRSYIAVYNSTPDSSNIMTSCDYNLYYNILPASANSILDSYDLDSHSIHEDPLFVDLSDNNYCLSKNSPAYQIGFKHLNWCSIGIRTHP